MNQQQFKSPKLTLAAHSPITTPSKVVAIEEGTPSMNPRRDWFNHVTMSDSPFTESWLSGPQGTKFYTRTYQPSSARAAVVFVHGFAEHIARYEHIFPTWSSRGIAIFTYDQRGFGRTALDKQNKSKDSSYGKTSWKEQFEDIEWAVQHAKQQFGVPVFLYGHSMGGALVLAFPTRTPFKECVSNISGVIATSPLILQAKPASKIARWMGEKASRIAPSVLIPAPVDPKALSHDEAVGEAYLKDPLVKLFGSLRGLSDMLDGGEALLAKDYAQWPKPLPVLLVHGTADQVTSCKATEKFHGLLSAEDKAFSPYLDGFHELHNEPNGVKEKLTEECIVWVEAHLLAERTSKL